MSAESQSPAGFELRQQGAEAEPESPQSQPLLLLLLLAVEVAAAVEADSIELWRGVVAAAASPCLGLIESQQLPDSKQGQQQVPPPPEEELAVVSRMGSVPRGHRH